MTPYDLTLSWMLWLCVGFLTGYRCHVHRVRKIIDARIKRSIELRRYNAVDRVIADVAIRCIEHPTDARVN